MFVFWWRWNVDLAFVRYRCVGVSAQLPARNLESAAERHREEIRTCAHSAGPSPGWALLPGTLHPPLKKIHLHSNVSYPLGEWIHGISVGWFNSFFWLGLSLVSSLRWSTSCVPALTHLDPPCAIWGPARTSCSLTCSTFPSSCPVSRSFSTDY